MLAFPVNSAVELLRRVKTHEMFVVRSDDIASAAKPDKLTKDTKWEDWAPSFLNYLRSIPGRDGTPLKYIVRDNELPDATPNVDFLDNYIMYAPLPGQALTIDAVEVHTFILNFITQNYESKSIIKIFENESNSRKDCITLKNHYGGQGIYDNDISKADTDLKNLFCAVEKKPHMWWIEFERRPNLAFQTYVKKEVRVVHSNEMKLRTLHEKVKCEWLNPIKVTIVVRLTKSLVTITYYQTLRAFKSDVNKKFSPILSTITPT